MGRARLGYQGQYQQYVYPESGVVVKLPNNRFMYGDIGRWVTEEINKHKMIRYFWGKNPHWNNVVFESIDRNAVEACMTKLVKASGSVATNTLKLIHV